MKLKYISKVVFSFFIIFNLNVSLASTKENTSSDPQILLKDFAAFGIVLCSNYLYSNTDVNNNSNQNLNKYIDYLNKDLSIDVKSVSGYLATLDLSERLSYITNHEYYYKTTNDDCLKPTGQYVKLISSMVSSIK